MKKLPEHLKRQSFFVKMMTENIDYVKKIAQSEGLSEGKALELIIAHHKIST